MAAIGIEVTRILIATSWPYVTAMVVLAIGTPFLSLVPALSGWRGTAIGLLGNAIGLVVGYRALTRVVERTRSQ